MPQMPQGPQQPKPQGKDDGLAAMMDDKMGNNDDAMQEADDATAEMGETEEESADQGSSKGANQATMEESEDGVTVNLGGFDTVSGGSARSSSGSGSGSGSGGVGGSGTGDEGMEGDGMDVDGPGKGQDQNQKNNKLGAGQQVGAAGQAQGLGAVLGKLFGQ
jgi:hypothetical protein